MGLLRVLLVMTVLTALPVGLRAQATDDAYAQWNGMNQNTIALINAGDVDGAVTSARATLAFAKVFMAQNHSELGSSYFNLGSVLATQGKHAEAQKIHEQGLEVRRRMASPDPVEIADSLQSIANAANAQELWDAAAGWYRQSVTAQDAAGMDAFFAIRGLAYAQINRDGRTGADTLEAYEAMRRTLTLWGARKEGNEVAYGTDIYNLLELAYAADRIGDEVDRAGELLAMMRAMEGIDPAWLGDTHRFLGWALEANGDHAGAEMAYRDAIAVAETIDGGVNRFMSHYTYSLGDMLERLGRYEEAERAFRRMLEVERALYGDADPETILSYNRLGLLLANDSRYSAAESLLRRGLALSEEVHGPDDLTTVMLADNLGLAIGSLPGKAEEAIALHRRALAVRQQVLGRVDPATSKTINNLALALERVGNFVEAQVYFHEALRIDRETLPAMSWEIGVALSNLASSLAAEGTVEGAVAAYGHYKEALAITRHNYPAQHADIANALDSLAMIARRAALFDEAGTYLREAAAIYAAPQNRATLADNWATFDAAMAVLLSLPGEHAAEAFELAQWPMQTAASKAIAASAQRAAAGDPVLARMVRDLQDLNVQNATLSAQVLASLGETDAERQQALRRDLEAVEARIAARQVEIATEFPDYAQLQAGAPASVAEVAAVLAPDEALAFIRPGHSRTDGDQVEGAVFLIRADGSVVTAPLERGFALQDDAQVLLCSVHAGVSGCPDASPVANLTRGAVDLSTLAPGSGGAPKRAFNLPLAHDLYQRIFGGITQELADVRRLILVPGDETLAALPFQMLLSAPAEDGDHAGAPWMIRDHAITVLPNVSALTHARRAPSQVAVAQAPRFLGVGDPVIGFERIFDCDDDDTLLPASIDRAVTPTATAALWQGGGQVADVSAVRALSRLPDTRCELQQIAQSLGGGTLLMQEQANEARIKALSEDGSLAGYDVISFATHGLVAGEIDNAEPALVLTPPAVGTPENDGLLTAGEIARLHLDAEWVLLSACNTAAGRVTARDGSVQAESFSGLARAFFYAGARTLLVSHWPVQSPAAVRLTTATFGALEDDPTLDRATAFQRAMLGVLDDPSATPEELHPRYWAPFTLLGQG